jgi:uncharacterized membrane protein
LATKLGYCRLPLQYKHNLMRVFGLIFGFILVMAGFCSLAISLIGLDFQWLIWLNSFGQMASFLIKIALAIFGLVIIAIARTNWDRERAESAK